MADVFISYAREDREIARAIAENLAAEGFDVWWDVNLLPGQEFADEISSVIHGAKAAIVLWTPTSTQSRWVKAETELAMGRGILIPVRLRDTDLPLPFNTLQTLDLRNWSGDSEDGRLNALIDAVLEKTGRKPEQVVARTEAEINEALEKPVHEVEFWLSIANKADQSLAEYEAYLERFGKDGAFSELAHIRILELGANSGKDASISFMGIKIPIDRRIATVLIIVVVLGTVWWNWQAVCDRTGWCGGPTYRIASLREELAILGPSKDRLSNIIAAYEFSDEPRTSIEEAKLLVAFIGSQSLIYRVPNAVTGTFGEIDDGPKFEISVWPNTYDKPSYYGIRYGVADTGYWGCNDTYFEVEKVRGGKAKVVFPPNFAPCQGDNSDTAPN